MLFQKKMFLIFLRQMTQKLLRQNSNDLSVEFNSTGEVENQTNCKMGEFGCTPDSISLFEEPQPTNNTSFTQTPKQSGNSGKKVGSLWTILEYKEEIAWTE